LQLLGIGVDMACGNTPNCTSVPRYISFNTDGPSIITATVSNTSAPVRVCLRQEPQLQQSCNTGKSATVQAFTTDAGSNTWTVSLIGRDSAATASLAVTFNANQPTATLDSFRWVGTNSPNYNGFVAVVGALADGQIQLHAAFDDGADGAYDWQLVIQPVPGNPFPPQSGGPSQTVDSQPQNVSSGNNYQVAFSDPDAMANPGAAVFVTATLSWP
jgi:hypothetical protein